MLFDTEFIIALTRRPGSASYMRARAFLQLHRPPGLYVSRVTFCEIATGFEVRTDAEAALAPFTALEIDAEVSWQASRIFRELQGKGLHIGDNDVWIAATALRFGLPLVSNNARHLGRVHGLDLRTY
ncbi:MAG: type II toxin-antitoxin system VapC family toxin [Burkholderiales bacterium]|nr:type II toxin-antitoxin system VapC family toxin [Opitutaceae bacterium]